MRVLVILMSGIFLVACSQFPTTHPDAAKNNPTQYRADMRDCARNYPESGTGAYLKQRVSCMELKGWQ
ncbi:hypothetical protein [Polynucleobacter asymbioticus]|uniref:hypothetical protein n=2 Tax=Polynucleobacter asymbioticus TaxID=576611 RepID=UPI0002DF8020|nr:hypothetical protein [Polynucleobacter asymbioticus]